MGDLDGERVLVTGGAGFIGRAVAPFLRRHGADVVVADLRPFPDATVRQVVGDLRHADVRERALDAGTTAVVHLAARTSVLESKRAPHETYATNVALTEALLERARSCGVDRFVLASTNAVTGDVGRTSIHERLAMTPLTPYGATKAAAEMLLSAYAGSYGMTTAALRLTNVYGPGMEDKDSFVPRLMRAARDGERVQIYGDGRQVRDLVHVDDVCRALGAVWSADAVGPVIVGAGVSISVLELVDAVRTVTGRPLDAEHVAPRPGEMPAVIVDIGRARALGYAPRTPLEAGLRAVWAEFAGAR